MYHPNKMQVSKISALGVQNRDRIYLLEPTEESWDCLPGTYAISVLITERRTRSDPSWTPTERRRSLLLFSRSDTSNSLQPHGPQYARASLSFTIAQSLLKLMPVESVTPSNQLVLCHPLLLLPDAFPSIRVSSNE